MRLTLLVATLAAVADAATTVAVLELGKGGVVRRTTSKSSHTSVSGVASFWSSLHSTGRKLQHAGMTVVPDLFNKADGGIVLGLMGSGVDLETMPTVSGLVEGEGNHVVGHMSLDGAQGDALLNKVGPADMTSASSLLSNAERKASQKGFSSMSVSVDGSNAAAVDAQVAALIQSLHQQAVESDRTVILHLVVEEEEGAGLRRLSSRRLQEVESNGEDNRKAAEANQGDNQGGYYGYGYYNAYGDWITPYKTMFQIQYFNVVLWSSVVLVIILLFSVYLMINMPLMADTLLFGESAKMMGG